MSELKMTVETFEDEEELNLACEAMDVEMMDGREPYQGVYWMDLGYGYGNEVNPQSQPSPKGRPTTKGQAP